MRVCRFGFDEMVLTGFYADDQVIPIDQAAEAYSRDMGIELLLPSTEDLLDLLPPDGSSYEAACELYAWIEQLDLIVARRADDPHDRTSGCWCRSPILPRCSSWRETTPNTSPSAAGRPPSAKRRFPTSS